MENLNQIVERLKSKQNVDAVFITGSQGDEHKSYSDIDLVIILKRHIHDLTTIYTWIGCKSADIFFFDFADLERIKATKEIPSNAMDGVFVDWLQKATICFDKSGNVTILKNNIDELRKKMNVPKYEINLFWNKINYNAVVNARYFESQDPEYHEALQLRLLNCVSEVFVGYFEFRNIPWRGEKMAMKYLKENDRNFYEVFIGYIKANNLIEKFEKYTALVKLVFTSEFNMWNRGDVIPQSKDRAKINETQLIEYWNQLIGQI